ncbi:hypothetical protein VTN77DRAFT_6006 [Rasamsonia byssochlamydoides]|uniref:uncharacterized protein n=1 Tax=Rasamsonia byssochlamydoides TaxID=89139 RepID=UPI003742786F
MDYLYDFHAMYRIRIGIIIFFPSSVLSAGLVYESKTYKSSVKQFGHSLTTLLPNLAPSAQVSPDKKRKEKKSKEIKINESSPVQSSPFPNHSDRFNSFLPRASQLIKLPSPLILIHSRKYTISNSNSSNRSRSKESYFLFFLHWSKKEKKEVTR